jgi:hypothetical protein
MECIRARHCPAHPANSPTPLSLSPAARFIRACRLADRNQEADLTITGTERFYGAGGETSYQGVKR